MMEDKFYYSDGTISHRWDYTKVLHREDGPAIEFAKGDKEWCITGIPLVYYQAQTGKYGLYDTDDTELTEEQARLLLASRGIIL